jgi:hypothetical protein
MNHPETVRLLRLFKLISAVSPFRGDVLLTEQAQQEKRLGPDTAAIMRKELGGPLFWLVLLFHEQKRSRACIPCLGGTGTSTQADQEKTLLLTG